MKTIIFIGAWIAASFILGPIVGKFISRGKGLVLVALVLAGSAVPVSAEGRFSAIDWSAYSVMVAGNVADLWTTQSALASGRAHEGNPALQRQGIGTITVAKVCGVVAIGVAMRTLAQHGHPKVARVLGFVDGGVTFTAAMHNQQVGRSQ